MVRMHLVESSSIRAIGYDEKSEELWIEFHSSPDPYVSPKGGPRSQLWVRTATRPSAPASENQQRLSG